MINIPVFGADKFQFPCRVIFGGMRMSKLVETGFKPSTKKRKLLHEYDNDCLTEGHTEAAMCVKGWLKNAISQT